MKNMSIAVVDYDCGNIHSATKALELAMSNSVINGSVSLTKDPEKILNSDKLVLPGVGAFGSCIQKLKSIDGLKEALDEAVLKKAKPILGICIGLQLMATSSFEGGKHNGLNWIEGDVIPLDPSDAKLKVPHMGWNQVAQMDHPMWAGIEDQSRFYFVHSYFVRTPQRELVAGTCHYGVEFDVALTKENLFAVQFHPEKSHTAGLQLLKNFVEWDGKL